MLGLIVLIVMGGYLALSIFLVIVTYKLMKKKGRAGRKAWLPAVLVGLVMYLLVFWDHVPTMVAHNYYCDKYAGFTVYKTVEQWKVENANLINHIPNSQEKKKYLPNYDVKKRELRKITKRNKYLGDLFEKKRIGYLPVTRITSAVYDMDRDTILSEYINFQSGYGNMMTSPSNQSWKFWLFQKKCTNNDKYLDGNKMKEYRKSIYNLFEGIK